ncbi:hypothetical protein [Nocardioides lijunqiniae]|uniref:hypothetical protein n=1 Tax=Nocardioides lijunqiniae TaxID=2760832 RepID=UPI0018782FB7|nr:hypothetical protein [Nocardioides lijunqiniae]
MSPTTPTALAFAQYFAHWGLELPPGAVEARADGHLRTAGWTVRWRWHDDGSLEFRASHRMTNERWELVRPDGTSESMPAPSEFLVFPQDADEATREAVRSAHRDAWRAHAASVAERGMAFEDVPSAPEPPA